ncbi:fumarylacetoacetate hydrolase family protein [Alteromonas lipolytica]|uniref:Isomerase/hydrolase n=1 Tax=Alteromonas lipolytica TaxID=1856405 RepID=A0A1E8FFL5_9ALTE|nr:fumarylacetoacetate hydrolase family protein [Alteromonas lipolytica]OFI34714.1 isomerase/hydrolase [Alteromonas lipolytica]GGF53414.1 isomerase/hydrolase [Alteromonas lipolytica]
MYQHQNDSGQAIDLPVGKVVCVGRNYLDHIQELNNEVPSEPLLFMKPATALCDVTLPVHIPLGLGECHNELEVALLIGQPLSQCTSTEAAAAAIWGIGLALDLTLRDVQQRLKDKGQPWERAKAFDGACPVSGFTPLTDPALLSGLEFGLTINGETRQQGNTKMMMRDALSLLCAISEVFSLQPGDIVLTGTPKGVGPLQQGDSLQLQMAPWFDISTRVGA